jgi:hypothetical protein
MRFASEMLRLGSTFMSASQNSIGFGILELLLLELFLLWLLPPPFLLLDFFSDAPFDERLRVWWRRSDDEPASVLIPSLYEEGVSVASMLPPPGTALLWSPPNATWLARAAATLRFTASSWRRNMFCTASKPSDGSLGPMLRAGETPN